MGSVDTAAATSLNAWNPDMNWPVRSIAFDGNILYAGGDFTLAGETDRAFTASFIFGSGGAGALTTWNPAPNNTVRSVLLAGSNVYLGGDFTQVSGTARNYLASVEATTAALTNWNPNANARIRALSSNGTTLYIGGDFTSVGGATRNRLAASTLSTGTITTLNPNASGPVHAISLQGSTRIALGGEFTTMGGVSHPYVTVLDSSGLPLVWNPILDDSVFAIDSDALNLYLGGAFTLVGSAEEPKTYLLQTPLP
jgi:hypothetical protein